MSTSDFNVLVTGIEVPDEDDTKLPPTPVPPTSTTQEMIIHTLVMQLVKDDQEGMDHVEDSPLMSYDVRPLGNFISRILKVID
jgi:hypothetical protein